MPDRLTNKSIVVHQLPNTIKKVMKPKTRTPIHSKVLCYRMQVIKDIISHLMQRNAMPCHAVHFHASNPNTIRKGAIYPCSQAKSDPQTPRRTENERPYRNQQELFHCLRRLVSRGPISGLLCLFPSDRGVIDPTPGSIGPGLWYPPPLKGMGIDIAWLYAGAL